MISSSIHAVLLFVWFLLFIIPCVYCKTKEKEVQLLKCPLDIKNITLNDSYSLEYFRYIFTCTTNFIIPMDSYFYVTYMRSCPADPMSSQVTFYTARYATGSFDTGILVENMFEPPELEVTISSENYPECFYINFTIERRKVSPFGKKKNIQLNLTNEPYYFDLKSLETGYTYIYENESPIRMYRLLCDNYNLVLADYTNIFLYNGTEKDHTLLGTFASRSSIFDSYSCDTGVLLYNFSILVVGPVLHTQLQNLLEFHFSTSKIMLLDNALTQGLSAIHVHVANFWEITTEMNLFWELNDTQEPLAVVLLSEEYSDGVYPEFELVGLTDIPMIPRFPNIEVYAGFLNFSQENLIVKYSEDNHSTTLPQKFGGKIRTLRVWSNETAQVAFSDSKMGNWEEDRYEDGYVPYPGGSARKIFQPFAGRTGFLRTNWLDGSYASDSTGLLELDEPDNITMHLYYSFIFKTPCEGAELQLTTIVARQLENFTYTCADGSVTLASRGIRAELLGDALVDYRISDRENFAQGSSCVSLFLVLLVFYAN